MNINLLLIILIALGIWRAVRGFKTGLAEEVNRLVSLVVALFGPGAGHYGHIQLYGSQ